VPAALLETLRAEKATMIVAEWRSAQPERIETDTEAYRMLMRSPVPVLIARGLGEPFDRVVVLARRQDLAHPGKRDLDVAMEVADRVAGQRPLVLVGPEAALAPAPLSVKRRHFEQADVSDPIAWAVEHLQPGDLVVLGGVDAAEDALERIAGMSERKFLFAVAAHPAAAAPVPHARSSGLVVGRTLTEAGA
jgi:hypothetical protein